MQRVKAMRPSSCLDAEYAGMPEDATTSDPNSPNGSEGCGVEQVPPSGVYEIEVDGTTREYHIVVPENYDPETEHKLIFVWHGLGGAAEREVRRNFFGLGNQNDGSAIFVAGQGLARMGPNGMARTGWSNRNGEDVNFAREMMIQLRSEYCIDNSRIFSTGWSFGGIMTNRLGCSLGEELRAIAPVMGQGPEFWRQTDCSEVVREADCAAGQVATWITHGSADTVVPYCGGERSRDYWQEANSCSSDSVSVGQNGCVEYEDCDDGYPVVWCPTDLGHTVPMFAAEEIWDFCEILNELSERSLCTEVDAQKN